LKKKINRDDLIMNEEKESNVRRFYSIYMIFIGIFGQLVFFAQAYKIFTTKHATDVSIIGFTAGLVSVTSWLIYGILLKDKPLIIANGVACLGALAALVGIIIYG